MKALENISEPYRSSLEWIYSQKDNMLSLLETWGNINSNTDNIDGLAAMLTALKSAFQPLGGQMQDIELPARETISPQGEQTHTPTGNALHIRKYPDAVFQVLLAGHMDTVHTAEGAFQKVEHLNDNKLQGPGVTDMKGGLVILLTALQALERSPFAGKIGWEVILNPDEEVGSPVSESFFIEAAYRNDVGLVFEPSYPDGALVSSRKGSANFTVVVKGRAAHSGRDFANGRNAVTAAAKLALSIEELTDMDKGITVNIGHLSGGTAKNIVPDLAIFGVNVRINEAEDLDKLMSSMQEKVATCNDLEGISATLYQQTTRLPKPFEGKNEELFNQINDCAKELGLDLKTRPSGGVCDGNILSAEGLPTVDTLGVIGGEIHTDKEYAFIDSLTERAVLTAYFLMKLGEQQSNNHR